ncbi:MAG: class I SAM-dependent DNA methyltransferase [Coriobacteriia bacterium]|nr:class I SAM-dependent DNA methyltransferase [Coriobacteriia bacterium]
MEEHVHSLVKVNVGQFYGIEINDFAVSVANAALWIADHQANQQTAKIFHRPLINLPLQDYQHIVVGNALRMDWNEVLPASECNYIMGNPPFLGARWMDASQKDDMLRTFNGARGIGNLDYVTAWYKKSAEYICETCIQAALVSTNSIAQGEQAGLLWKSLLDDNMKIDFAHRTFKWNSEARGVAAVHCVIIGFSKEDTRTKREIYFTDGLKKEAKTINPYLVDAPTVFVERRMSPLSAPHQMVFGSMPNDGGNLILSDEEKGLIEKMNPLTAKYIRRFMMGAEFINARIRWCLWLLDASPSDLHSMPEVMKRVERVRMHRASSHRDSTQKLAETPTLFGEIRQPSSDYIALPKVSSERRRYIPIGYLSAQVIAGDKLFVVPGGTLFDFGIMTSQFHNAWMRVVAGRLKSDYSYSNTIVYNNFVWPEPTDEQRERIEELAQVVLDARDNYPDSSLADLYDPLTMPPDLLRAHQALDKAVEQAYGVNFRGDETKIVSHLFKLYAEATKD